MTTDPGTPFEEVVVLDFGSQYAQLIARRVREQHVFCRIVPPTMLAEDIRTPGLRGVILSGGPASVYDDGAPGFDPAILDLGVPVLGICYGMQLISHILGLKVEPAHEREFGHQRLHVVNSTGLLSDTPEEQTVWMSHGDRVEGAGEVFEVLGRTGTCPLAAVRHREREIYGLQFHPEVVHTEAGRQVLRNFLFQICRCAGSWRMSSFVDDAVGRVRAQIGKSRAICGLSGGVDSMVAAALVDRAIGDRLTCIFVDNGLLRAEEREDVERAVAGHLADIDFRVVDARERFLEALHGVTDPEVKRKQIGHVFIDVFREAASGIVDARFLVQGTLYPDVIESVSAFGGPSSTIKTHHNVGGLPAELGFELVEPLRDLFKDEVREAGVALGLPDEVVWRHPFPGPGLAVRLLGPVTPERLAILREADLIVRREIRDAGLEREIWQAFAVLLPVNTVGVMGDQRTYESVCAVRAVTSTDAMTAEWARLPHELLARMSRRIVNEVRGINRVVYDISSKPPATIEWE